MLAFVRKLPTWIDVCGIRSARICHASLKKGDDARVKAKLRKCLSCDFFKENGVLQCIIQYTANSTEGNCVSF